MPGGNALLTSPAVIVVGSLWLRLSPLWLGSLCRASPRFFRPCPRDTPSTTGSETGVSRGLSEEMPRSRRVVGVLVVVVVVVVGDSGQAE